MFIFLCNENLPKIFVIFLNLVPEIFYFQQAFPSLLKEILEKKARLFFYLFILHDV